MCTPCIVIYIICYVYANSVGKRKDSTNIATRLLDASSCRLTLFTPQIILSYAIIKPSVMPI